MKNPPFRIIAITVEPDAGSMINDVIHHAIQLAIEHDAIVRFTFNGEKLIARPDSSMDALYAEFRKSIKEHT
jgi:hypothetical protein